MFHVFRKLFARTKAPKESLDDKELDTKKVRSEMLQAKEWAGFFDVTNLREFAPEEREKWAEVIQAEVGVLHTFGPRLGIPAKEIKNVANELRQIAEGERGFDDAGERGTLFILRRMFERVREDNMGKIIDGARAEVAHIKAKAGLGDMTHIQQFPAEEQKVWRHELRNAANFIFEHGEKVGVHAKNIGEAANQLWGVAEGKRGFDDLREYGALIMVIRIFQKREGE